jgi:hypothetical protein
MFVPVSSVQEVGQILSTQLLRPKKSSSKRSMAQKLTRAAREQVVSGDPTGIAYEDRDGRWHDEVSAASGKFSSRPTAC